MIYSLDFKTQTPCSKFYNLSNFEIVLKNSVGITSHAFVLCALRFLVGHNIIQHSHTVCRILYTFGVLTLNTQNLLDINMFIIQYYLGIAEPKP